MRSCTGRPDLDQAIALAAQPGWAWAPGDRWQQDGTTHPGCGRGFTRRMYAAAAVELRMAFETEWYLERRNGTPATSGPAYGVERLFDLAGFATELLSALEAQGVPVVQFHPEAAPGQFELSVTPADPVRAADLAVLVRLTIRAVAARHDLRVSFAPCIATQALGNGAHLHLSPWRAGANLLSDGTGPHGMTEAGQAAAVRLIASPANLELRCVDGAANPYLVAGAVCAVISGGRSAALPNEVTVDPATLPDGRQPLRLPRSLAEAAECLAHDDLLGQALSAPLRAAILRVRRAEVATWAGREPDELIQATRWRY